MSSATFFAALVVSVTGFATGSLAIALIGCVCLILAGAWLNRSGRVAQHEASRRLAEHQAAINGKPDGNVDRVIR